MVHRQRGGEGRHVTREWSGNESRRSKGWPSRSGNCRLRSKRRSIDRAERRVGRTSQRHILYYSPFRRGAGFQHHNRIATTTPSWDGTAALYTSRTPDSDIYEIDSNVPGRPVTSTPESEYAAPIPRMGCDRRRASGARVAPGLAVSLAGAPRGDLPGNKPVALRVARQDRSRYTARNPYLRSRQRTVGPGRTKTRRSIHAYRRPPRVIHPPGGAQGVRRRWIPAPAKR